MSNPFKIVDDFEKAVAEYTGAAWAVSVNSCTNALFLCLEWQNYINVHAHEVTIPKKTYIGVAQSIKNAGLDLWFEDLNWEGWYQLKPFPIWDSAKRFKKDMCAQIAMHEYFVCTSHHWAKILGIQQGGCILTNNKDAVDWLRRARFDGRTPGIPASQERQPIRGWHMYMSPEVAAEGLVRLALLPEYPPDQPMDNYPDLSQMEIFKNE